MLTTKISVLDLDISTLTLLLANWEVTCFVCVAMPLEVSDGTHPTDPQAAFHAMMTTTRKKIFKGFQTPSA